MKTIYLMRHAKTEPGRTGLADEKRGLTDRGVADSALMGQWLAKQTPQPEMVFLSTAKRTGQTVKMVNAQRDKPIPTQAIDALYLAWASELADLIRSQDDLFDSLLIINHEPGLSTLTRTLALPDTAPECARAFDHFPTGGIAVLQMDIESWGELAPQSAQFKNFVTPKDVPKT